MSHVTQTGSQIGSSTMTEARVRTVMHPVAANFLAFVVAGHIDRGPSSEVDLRSDVPASEKMS